jgi:peptide deformylase
MFIRKITGLSMPIRKLIYLPDARLRQVAEPVVSFDDSLQQLIDDMFDTMYEGSGVGLAAPQVGIGLRVVVVDIAADKTDQMVLINPEIIDASGEQACQEGCLSVPGVYETVMRAKNVTVRALNRLGDSIEITAEDFLADCLQHEIDHLNGKLFVDHLSPLKRTMARKKLEKFKRENTLL